MADRGAAKEEQSVLRLETWQFVRIMVALEAMPGSKAARLWGAAWREIDNRLTHLGKTDAESFAALMMEQEVVLPVAGPHVVRETVRALRRVDRELAALLSGEDLPEDQRAALRFERQALRRLERSLARRRGARRRANGAAQ